MIDSVVGKHIVLAGFMGVGKTTTGEILSELLGCGFADTDALISRMHGPPRECFEREGERWFREREHEALGALLANRDTPCVIAIGGGTLTHPDSADLLLGGDVACVALTASVDVVLDRVAGGMDSPHRPLLTDPNTLGSDIHRLWSVRERDYAQFSLVDTSALVPRAAADAVIRTLGIQVPDGNSNAATGGIA